MKTKNGVIIILAMLLSTSYIFAIDYYDMRQTTVQDIYAAISLPGIQFTDIRISLTGQRQEALEVIDLCEREQSCIQKLAHENDCSKLCTEIHETSAVADVTMEEEDKLQGVASAKSLMSSYSLSIKNQKDINHNSYYKLNIQGLEDLVELDRLRSDSIDLFKEWDVEPNESVCFLGTIEGNVGEVERFEYKTALLKALKARFTGYYQDDLSGDTQAYYAYTKSFDDYILDGEGKKTNTQISFSYNEVEDVTQIIIAFPFYNEPF